MGAEGQGHDNQAKGMLAPASPKAWAVIIGIACLIAGVIITNARNGEGEYKSVVESSDNPAASATLAEEATAIWTQFETAARDCDQASDRVKAELQSPDGTPYSTYPLAKDAVYACDAATSAIFALEPPNGAPDALKEEFQTALSACYRAYRGKQNVFQRLTKVLDGDTRPSTMQAVQNEMQTAEGHMITCVPGLMAAVEQATGKFSEPAQR
jgi:hypothetical protein